MFNHGGNSSLHINYIFAQLQYFEEKGYKEISRTLNLGFKMLFKTICCCIFGNYYYEIQTSSLSLYEMKEKLLTASPCEKQATFLCSYFQAIGTHVL